MKTKFKLGADPEYGIYSSKIKATYPPICLSKWDKVPTIENKEDKEHPFFIKDNNSKVAVHMDGAAFELLVPPSDNPTDLYNSIQSGLSMARSVIKPFSYLSLSDKPALPWDIKEFSLEKVGEDIIYSTRFGCDPDYDAWEGEGELQEEEDASLHPYRYFGGHIHIGVEYEVRNIIHSVAPTFAKFCAIYLGTLCTSESRHPEEEQLRLYRYGKPGRYRLPAHGFEYRSPSNSWTTNLDIIKNIYTSVEKLLEVFTNIEYGKKVFKLAEDARSAIIDYDIEACKQIHAYAIDS